MSSHGLKALDRDECAALLTTQRIARVGLARPEPMVPPVQYAIFDGDIVFRTAPGEKLIAAVLGRTVAFEIDDFDVAARTGWSVVTVGPSEEVVDRNEPTACARSNSTRGTGELRDRFVRIRTEELSGRRIDPAP